MKVVDMKIVGSWREVADAARTTVRIEAAANLEKRKVKEAINALMACCEYRTCRGTCGFLDKDDRTYTCSRANCPHIDDKVVRP